MMELKARDKMAAYEMSHSGTDKPQTCWASAGYLLQVTSDYILGAEMVVPELTASGPNGI